MPLSEHAAASDNRPEGDHNNLDIVFIDKYIDPTQSLSLLNTLQKKFMFSDAVKRQLSSGLPVVIKHDTDAETAQRIIDYIASLGGDCWAQSSCPDGYVDRRDQNRRHIIDRRLLHRGWAIMPDRRRSRERRVFFH